MTSNPRQQTCFSFFPNPSINHLNHFSVSVYCNRSQKTSQRVKNIYLLKIYQLHFLFLPTLWCYVCIYLTISLRPEAVYEQIINGKMGLTTIAPIFATQCAKEITLPSGKRLGESGSIIERNSFPLVRSERKRSVRAKPKSPIFTWYSHEPSKRLLRWRKILLGFRREKKAISRG